MSILDDVGHFAGLGPDADDAAADEQRQRLQDDAKRRQRFAWGGQAGELMPDGTIKPGTTGADDASRRYQQMGRDAANRGAYQMDPSGFNAYTDQAWGDRSNAQQARGAQVDALGLQRQAALGNAPSVAQIQMQSGLDAAARSQQSLAAGARGPAALALAQQQAAGNTAMMQQQGVGQMSALRAQEMADARNAYMGGASAIRGQDYQGQGLSFEGQRNQLGWQQAQGQLEMGQRQLNQQGQMGYEQMGWNTQQAQLQAQQAQQASEEGHWQAQTATDQNASDRVTKIIGSGIGAGGAALGVAASDPRAKLNVRSESMGTWAPVYLQQGPVPNAADGRAVPFVTSDPRAKLNPRAEAMGTYPPWMPPFPVPSGANHGVIPLVTSDPRSKMSVSVSSPTARSIPMHTRDAHIAYYPRAASSSDDDTYSAASEQAMRERRQRNMSATEEGHERVTSDPRAKNNAYLEGAAAAMRSFGGSMAGTGPGPMESYAKRDRSPPTEQQKMMRTMQPASWNYDQRAVPDGGQRNYGVMTTDLKKSPMGSSIVEPNGVRGPNGQSYDAIDTRKASTAALANTADLQQQIDDLKLRQRPMGRDDFDAVNDDEREYQRLKDWYANSDRAGEPTWGAEPDRRPLLRQRGGE